MGDVIRFDPPRAMVVTETVHMVQEGRYVARRCADRLSGQGFVQVRDEVGKPILVFPARIPPDCEVSMIIAWLCGFGRGYAAASTKAEATA